MGLRLGYELNASKYNPESLKKSATLEGMALRYYYYILLHHEPFSVNNDAENNSA
jgi:hypothetical protein